MMNCYARSMVGANHAQIPDNLVEEFLQWKPLAEPRFQEAVAEVGVINTGGSMWTDLINRATRELAAG